MEMPSYGLTHAQVGGPVFWELVNSADLWQSVEQLPAMCICVKIVNKDIDTCICI